jgi:hypothetical protein
MSNEIRVPKMSCRLLALLLVAVAGGFGQTTIPDTPAGHTLQAWLDAFNSGDREKIETYLKAYDLRTTDPNKSPYVSLSKRTGGYELLSIESSEPLRIRFGLKAKNGSSSSFGNLLVKDGQPAMVESFVLRLSRPGEMYEYVTVDAAMRKKVIDGVEVKLREYYVEPTVAQQMIDALKANQTKGDYDAISDGDALATRLTTDLRAVSQDKHLRIDFSHFKALLGTGPVQEDEALFHQQMERENCGFDKVEILPNNIGYIKFDEFMDTSFCGPTVAAAMGFVAHTDAIIFDLRQNGGGQATTVALIASYLFDRPTHLIDIYNRKENSTTQNWTLSDLPGPRLTKQPVFVLTAAYTFSGAEEFAFDLKNQKRATIVGETTGGGAHPISQFMVTDHFKVTVPSAKSFDPITKKDWEGTGVEPDMKVPAADALETAEKLAMEKIQAKEIKK